MRVNPPDGAAPEADPAPLVFVSHASEDKEDFAEPLARALYAGGVRAWLDKWEMQPGDSVISKIFDEGIAKADCFVVVVSEHSVRKRWVREELDSGVVERINRSCRLIPIRLGEVEMPAPLRATIWISADRSKDGAIAAAEEIARVLHGHDARPALGQPAPYLAQPRTVAGLASDESLLLIRLAERAIAQEHLIPSASWQELVRTVEADGITEATATEAAHALNHAGYVELAGSVASRVARLQLTKFGFAAALPALRPDWETLRSQVIAELVNDPPSDVATLAQRVDAPILIVQHFVSELDDRGLLTCLHDLGGGTHIRNISPALRRLAR